MLTVPEREAGITYLELDIRGVDRCKGSDCKTYCPKCYALRRNKSDKPLSVNLDRGEWKCHHCGWHSGLGIEARSRSNKNGSLNTATRGSQSNPRGVSGSPSGRSGVNSPEPPPLSLPSTHLHDAARNWLHKRGITDAVIAQFGIVSSEKHGKTWIHFPYLRDGSPVNIKSRQIGTTDIAFSEVKNFVQSKGAARTLYNHQTTPRGAKICVVEGEMDVLACAVAGWDAVSAPDGAPGKIIDPHTGEVKGIAEVGSKGAAFLTDDARAMFDQVKRIVIATDGDEEGQKLAEWLQENLPAVKLWTVTWPEGCKDANDVLMQHGAKKLDEVLGNAKPIDMPGIRSLMDSFDEANHIYQFGFDPGVSTGWLGFDGVFKWRKGNLVGITGNPGHGKTSLLNHALVNLAYYHNWKIALFSPEGGSDGELLGKFAQIVADAPFLPGSDHQMPFETFRLAAKWVDTHFKRIDGAHRDTDLFETVSLNEIIERMEWLVLKEDFDCLVLDPWNRLESMRPKHQTPTEYIATALNALSRFARRHHICVIIVAHPAKPDASKRGKQETMPSPYDMSDSARWNDMLDFILGIHRDKWNEDPAQRNVTEVRVWKNRWEGVSGELGSCYFRFQRATGRFYDEGVEVPNRFGAHPYIDLPDALLTSPRPQVVEAAWEEEEAF